MHIESKASIGLGRQFITCTILCGLSVVLILLFHPKPHFLGLLSGLPLFQQASWGFALGGLYYISARLGYKYVAGRKSAESVVKSYSRLDLTGWNPVWIALAAGFGEELLFRGTLQPLLGVWATSLLFVLAHTKAYRFNGFSSRVLIQALGIFVVSVGFGFISQYIGLFAAMIVHAAMDVVGLYTIRRVAHVQAAA